MSHVRAVHTGAALRGCGEEPQGIAACDAEHPRHDDRRACDDVRRDAGHVESQAQGPVKTPFGARLLRCRWFASMPDAAFPA